MYKLLKNVCMLWRRIAERQEKRRALRTRLQRLFFMDSLEGQLDCLIRSTWK